MRPLSESFGADDLEGGLLARRVREAVSWCLTNATVADPRGSLRRLPDPLNDIGALHAEARNVVQELVRSRERLVPRTPVQKDLAGGQLLVYFPEEDLADGAAELETRGFFDIHNTPPWDSWVALIEDPSAERFKGAFLLAYVPPVLIPLADRGIEVNPEACISWLDAQLQQRLGI